MSAIKLVGHIRVNLLTLTSSVNVRPFRKSLCLVTSTNSNFSCLSHCRQKHLFSVSQTKTCNDNHPKIMCGCAKRYLQTSGAKGGLMSPREPKIIVDEDEWRKIYKFKYIVAARAIQRVKVYQTIFTCGIVAPITFVSFLLGIATVPSVIFVASSCGVASKFQ